MDMNSFYDFAQTISDIARHPFVLLLFGSGILKLFSDSRLRKEKLLDARLEFIEETAQTLHCVIPLIFRQIREKRFTLTNENDLLEKKAAAFAFRLRMEMKSKALFGSDDFYKKLDDALWSIHFLLEFFLDHKDLDVDLTALQEQMPTLMEEIDERINTIVEKGSSVIKKYDGTHVTVPIDDELFDRVNKWANLIYIITRRVLDSALEQTLNQKKCITIAST